MKKTTRKLVLRKELIRELSGQALTRVIGGQETNTADVMSQTGDKQCGSHLIVTLDKAARDNG